MRSSFESVSTIVDLFKACTGPFIAKDPKTGAQLKVLGLEDRTKLNPALAVLFEDGTERVFSENYVGRHGPGSYMLLEDERPYVEGCESTAFEIRDGGMDDYYPPDGCGQYDPVLALTLVNTGAEAKNAPLIAAWRDARDRAQRAHDAACAAIRAQKMDRRLNREHEAASSLKAKLAGGIRDVRVECRDGSLMNRIILELADGSRLQIDGRHELKVTKIFRDGSKDDI